MYGYKTWSLTLREEHGPRMSQNKVFRRLFGPKRQEENCIWGASQLLCFS